MDESLFAVIKKHIDKTMVNLQKNNMDAYFVQTKAAAADKVKELLTEGETVASGGSATLGQTGILDLLRSGKYHYLDRSAPGIDVDDVFRRTFSADSYLVSSNAVTEEGELYNVDGMGNRVSAMIFGPKSVIVVAGYNKIVKDRDEAVERVKRSAAPANVVRLGGKAACAKTGECVNCANDARICCSYVFLARQRIKGRIKVIIVGEELGY